MVTWDCFVFFVFCLLAFFDIVFWFWWIILLVLVRCFPIETRRWHVFIDNRSVCKYTMQTHRLSRVLRNFYFPVCQIDVKIILTNQDQIVNFWDKISQKSISFLQRTNISTAVSRVTMMETQSYVIRLKSYVWDFFRAYSKKKVYLQRQTSEPVTGEGGRQTYWKDVELNVMLRSTWTSQLQKTNRMIQHRPHWRLHHAL